MTGPRSNQGEQFFPPFSGEASQRTLNLLFNANPLTFGIRGFFLTQPEIARMLGPMADQLIQSQGLPGNLYNPARTPARPFQVGDRVRSPQRTWPASSLFGGYIMSINDAWAVVQWDFVPIGPLTYDPLTWLEPQVLRRIL